MQCIHYFFLRWHLDTTSRILGAAHYTIPIMVLTAVRASDKLCATHVHVHWHISFCTHCHSVTAHAAGHGKLNHADEVTDGVALPHCLTASVVPAVAVPAVWSVHES